MPSLGSAYVQVRGDFNQLNKQLVANLHPSRLGKFGKAAGIGIGAGLAAGVAGKGLFDLGSQFDEQFDKIRVGTGATGRALEGLQEDFKAVAKSTPADFGSIGDAVTGLNQRLNLTGKPLQTLAKQITELSRITGTSVQENVATITRLFGDWGIQTGKQSSQLDKLFRVTQRTGIPLARLSDLMVQFGAPLRQLGFGFDEAATMFGKFEKEGVNLATILPGFRFALKNLSAPSGEAADALKKLGIAAKDPKVALQEVMAAIKDAPSNLKANAIAFAIFGKRAGPDMAAAIREGRFEYDGLLNQIRTGRDTIKKAGKDTRDFGEEWQLLKNQLAVTLEPIASDFFEAIGDGLRFLRTHQETVKTFARIVGVLTAAFVSYRVAVGGAAAATRAYAVLAGTAATQSAVAATATTAAGAQAIAAGAAAGGAAGGFKTLAARMIGVATGAYIGLEAGKALGKEFSEQGQGNKLKGFTKIVGDLSESLFKIRKPSDLGDLFKGSPTEEADKRAAPFLKAQREELFKNAAAEDRIRIARDQARASIPAIVAAERRLVTIRAEGKGGTHAEAVAIRALDAAQGARLAAVRESVTAEKEAERTAERGIGAAFKAYEAAKQQGLGARDLAKYIRGVARANSNWYASQVNITRAMRGLTPVTEASKRQLGDLLRTLKGVKGIEGFRKFTVTADISSVNAAIRLVGQLQGLGRAKTALKIIADAKSPEQALERLRKKLHDLEDRQHRFRVEMRDEATLRLDRLIRKVGDLPRGKITVDVVGGRMSIATKLERALSEAFTRAGMGQAGKAFRIPKQRGGMIPGVGDGDKVPALLEPGEGVINKRAVKARGGPPWVNRINRDWPRFQRGGVIGRRERRLAAHEPVLNLPAKPSAQHEDRRRYEDAKHWVSTVSLPRQLTGISSEKVSTKLVEALREKKTEKVQAFAQGGVVRNVFESVVSRLSKDQRTELSRIAAPPLPAPLVDLRSAHDALPRAVESSVLTTAPTGRPASRTDRAGLGRRWPSVREAAGRAHATFRALPLRTQTPHAPVERGLVQWSSLPLGLKTLASSPERPQSTSVRSSRGGELARPESIVQSIAQQVLGAKFDQPPTLYQPVKQVLSGLAGRDKTVSRQHLRVDVAAGVVPQVPEIASPRPARSLVTNVARTHRVREDSDTTRRSSLVESAKNVLAKTSERIVGTLSESLTQRFDLVPGTMPAIPQMAKGGKTQTALAVVGEEGPELAELPVGTRVHSHPVSKRIAKGLGIQAFAKGGEVKAIPPTAQIVKADDKFVVMDGKEVIRVVDSLRDLHRETTRSTVRDTRSATHRADRQDTQVTQRSTDSRTDTRSRVRDVSEIRDRAQRKIITDAVRESSLRETTSSSSSLLESVRSTVKARAFKRDARFERGGDSNDPGRRLARASSQGIGTVTPSEVTQITQRWGVNRAVASIAAAVEDKFPAMQIISGFRSGATTKSGSRSNHAVRAALDLGSRGGLNRRIGTWVRANFSNSVRGVSEGVLDIDHDPNPPDHADHVHVAALGSEAISKVMQTGADGGGTTRPRRFKKLSLGQYVTVAKQVGFPDPALAAAIFYAESRGDVNAVGDSGQSMGAAQIHLPSHPRLAKQKDKLRDDIFFNFREAKKIARGGRDFSPWTQFRNGAYKPFLGGRAQKLPKGGKGAPPSGSSLADYWAFWQDEATETPGLKDDYKWINKQMSYWRGVLRRNRASNPTRAKDARGNIRQLREDKKALRPEIPDDAFKLDDLAFIGKDVVVPPGKRFPGSGPPPSRDHTWNGTRWVKEAVFKSRRVNIGGIQKTLDRIDLDIAAAGLTETFDGNGNVTPASYADDIKAATEFVNVWTGVKQLAFGESQSLTSGTIKQKIEAATELKTARDALKSVQDEAKSEEVPLPEAKTDLSAVFAEIAEIMRLYAPNFRALPRFAKGGTLGRTAEALVGEQGREIAEVPVSGARKALTVLGQSGPEIRPLPVGTRIYSHPESKRIAQDLGFQAFAGGGTVRPDAIVAPRDKVEVVVKQEGDKARRPDVVQHLHFVSPPEDQHTVQKAALWELRASV